MRDDFKNNKNFSEEDSICAYKRMFERCSIELFEKMYNIKFTKFQKWYLNRLFKRDESNKTSLSKKGQECGTRRKNIGI